MRKLIKLLRLLGRSKYRAGLRRGVGAAIEHEVFLKSHPFATLLDAGANKGQFALAARAARPQATIISFEPLAGPALIFERVFRGDPFVRLVRTALGSNDGETDIHLSRRIDSSSLLPIGELQSRIFPGTEELRTERIRVARLDGAIDAEKLARPLILKMDVQGFELELLKGAERTLHNLDGIYAELSFVQLYQGQSLAHEVIAWLDEREFNLAGVYHVTYDGRGTAVQADMFFRRHEKRIEPSGVVEHDATAQ